MKNSITIANYQSTVTGWEQKFKFRWPLYVKYIHLVEEIGELGEALTVQTGDRKSGSGKGALADHSNPAEELGDVLFALFSLSNELDIDMTNVIEETFKRYQKKLDRLSKRQT